MLRGVLSVPIFWVKRSENEITHIKVGSPRIALRSESDLGGGLCFEVLPIIELLCLADLVIQEAVLHPEHFLHSLGRKCHCQIWSSAGEALQPSWGSWRVGHSQARGCDTGMVRAQQKGPVPGIMFHSLPSLE